MLWRIGQAAGSAVLMALQSGNAAVQDVNVTAVQESLYNQGVAYHYPARQACNSPVPPPPPPPPPPSPPNCTLWTVSWGEGGGDLRLSLP